MPLTCGFRSRRVTSGPRKSHGSRTKRAPKTDLHAPSAERPRTRRVGMLRRSTAGTPLSSSLIPGFSRGTATSLPPSPHTSGDCYAVATSVKHKAEPICRASSGARSTSEPVIRTVIRTDDRTSARKSTSLKAAATRRLPSRLLPAARRLARIGMIGGLVPVESTPVTCCAPRSLAECPSCLHFRQARNEVGKTSPTGRPTLMS
jgi:hypothetical protein